MSPAPDDVEIAAPDRGREAEEAYLLGLALWNAQRWSSALRLARQALAADPALEPAQLLEAAALMRVEGTAAGLGRLDALAAGADDPRVRVGAAELRRHATVHHRREQWAFGLGNGLAVEAVGDTPRMLAGLEGSVQAPLSATFAVRLGVGTPLGGGETFDVRGPHADLLLTAHRPVGRGVVSADVGVGPGAWLALGPFWPEQHEFYLGARASAGLDVRTGPRGFFLRIEAGATWLPEARADLRDHARYVDTRVLMGWFVGDEARLW